MVTDLAEILILTCPKCGGQFGPPGALVSFFSECRPSPGKAVFVFGKTETRETHFPIFGDSSLASDMAADIHENEGNASVDRSTSGVIWIGTEKAESRV